MFIYFYRSDYTLPSTNNVHIFQYFFNFLEMYLPLISKMLYITKYWKNTNRFEKKFKLFYEYIY